MVEAGGRMTIKVGAAEIQRVEEIRQRMPIAALTSDQAILGAASPGLQGAFFDPADQSMQLVFQAWILQLDGLTVVVDPCNGDGRERRVFPFFHRLATPFLERFEATGVRPEDVDFVFCTHLHCDHCGWNTRLRDGRWTPTFPNARYLFVRREVERWDPARPGHVEVEYNVGVFEDSVAPIIDAGLAELVDDHATISPALAIQPAYGHTNGHSVLHLDQGEAQAIFTGDAFHHPLQVTHPELHLSGCDDLAAAIETRRRLCATLAETGGLMLPAHFPEPHCGHVAQRAGVYEFAPLA
jgi:glyoxylase-like metal-dependent hydrolase (beta-lactamase superfamily II)